MNGCSMRCRARSTQYGRENTARRVNCGRNARCHLIPTLNPNCGKRSGRKGHSGVSVARQSLRDPANDEPPGPPLVISCRVKEAPRARPKPSELLFHSSCGGWAQCGELVIPEHRGAAERRSRKHQRGRWRWHLDESALQVRTAPGRDVVMRHGSLGCA